MEMEDKERTREKVVDGMIKAGAAKQLTGTAGWIIVTTAPPRLQSHHCVPRWSWMGGEGGGENLPLFSS